MAMQDADQNDQNVIVTVWFLCGLLGVPWSNISWKIYPGGIFRATKSEKPFQIFTMSLGLRAETWSKCFLGGAIDTKTSRGFSLLPKTFESSSKKYFSSLDTFSLRRKH